MIDWDLVGGEKVGKGRKREGGLFGEKRKSQLLLDW